MKCQKKDGLKGWCTMPSQIKQQLCFGIIWPLLWRHLNLSKTNFQWATSTSYIGLAKSLWRKSTNCWGGYCWLMMALKILCTCWYGKYIHVYIYIYHYHSLSLYLCIYISEYRSKHSCNFSFPSFFLGFGHWSFVNLMESPVRDGRHLDQGA